MNKYIKYAFALALPPVGYCLLYTSDAADDLIGVDLGGRRIIKKKKRAYCRSVPTSMTCHENIKA